MFSDEIKLSDAALNTRRFADGVYIMLNRAAIVKGFFCEEKTFVHHCGIEWVVAPVKGKKPNLVFMLRESDASLEMYLYQWDNYKKSGKISLAAPDAQDLIAEAMRCLEREYLRNNPKTKPKFKS